MRNFFLKLHRDGTVYGLHRLLRKKAPAPVYAPVPGRLLYVAASCLPYHISGYTTRTHEILCALKGLGHDVHAFTRTGYPWDRKDRLCDATAESTTLDGVLYEHRRHPSNRRLVLQFAVQASAVIAQHAAERKVAVIHAASNHTNALPALLAARRLGIPFQYEMRGLWELTRASRMPAFENSHNFKLGLELEGLVAAHADRVFVISEQLGKFAQELWAIPAQRLFPLPNCVDVARIRAADPAKVVPNSIGYAGSLIVYEGLDTLIQAVGRLKEQVTDLRLEIIGDGEARPQLEELVQRLGLTASVRLHGKLAPDKARALLGRCALACIPRKPFQVCQIVPPIKLVEAMAMGKPVIVPDLPVFRDEIGQSSGAFFFRAGEVEDLSRVLADALASPQRLADWGAMARESVLMRRQWRDYVDKLPHTALEGIDA